MVINGNRPWPFRKYPGIVHMQSENGGPTPDHGYKYYCRSCAYGCNKKSLWQQHASTRKHARHCGRAASHDLDGGYECGCGKKYKYLSGLSRHRRRCQCGDGASRDGDIQCLVAALARAEEVKSEMMQQLKEQSSMIREMLPCMGNNTNNFSINVFLNETCREAINMSEFVASLQVHLEDLEYTRDNGLAEGISSMLVNGLRQLDTCKRPIHCTDAKRETLYIKENDGWEKGEGETGKMPLRSAIGTIADKQRKAIAEWEAEHPGWEDSEKGKDEYLTTVRSVMADVSQRADEDKIIKSIAKETAIGRETVSGK